MDKISEMVEIAREAGRIPRIHGNGFIQLDINETDRLNFWGHPEIPRQLSPSPVHSHRFHFVSQCLKGRLTNCFYRWFAGGKFEKVATHEAYAVRRHPGNEATDLETTGERGYLIPTNLKITMPNYPGNPNGAFYQMRADDFHESFASEPTVTLMRKHGIQEGVEPRVLVPIGKAPSNDWTRDRHPDFLWRLIWEILE